MSTQNHKRLKILLGCYACNPYYGSEPGTGWNFMINIAKYHDVHAIIEEEVGMEDLLQYREEHPEELKNVTFHFIKRNRYRILRKIYPPSYYWTYRQWQKKAYKLAKELDKKENFDLIHQITLVGYREPGYLWKLGKPFIWGPLGGFCQTPLCLLKNLTLYNKVYFIARNILNTLQKRYSYTVRKAYTSAHCILVSDPQAVEDVKNIWNKTPTVMREVGTSLYALTEEQVSTHTKDEPLRVCWSGNLITLKALDLLLHALHLCHQPIRLEIIGKGPKDKEWKQLSEKLGLFDKVQFHGFLPHDKATRLMSQCHVFCITSIKEGGTPTVALEALQNGLPLIVLNHCGFASVVNDSCGFKINLSSRAQIIEDIARLLDRLAVEEELRHKLAIGALHRSNNFTWEAKIQHLNKIYANAVKERL